MNVFSIFLIWFCCLPAPIPGKDVVDLDSQSPEYVYVALTGVAQVIDTIIPDTLPRYAGLRTQHNSEPRRCRPARWTVHVLYNISTLYVLTIRGIVCGTFKIHRNPIVPTQMSWKLHTTHTPIFNDLRNGPICTRKNRKDVCDKSADMKMPIGAKKDSGRKESKSNDT